MNQAIPLNPPSPVGPGPVERRLWLLPALLCLVTLGAGAAHLGACSSTPARAAAFEGAASKAVELAAGYCVVVAHDKGDGQTESVCVTIEEIAEQVDRMLAARTAADGGAK